MTADQAVQALLDADQNTARQKQQLIRLQNFASGSGEHAGQIAYVTPAANTFPFNLCGPSAGGAFGANSPSLGQVIALNAPPICVSGNATQSKARPSLAA